MRRESLGLSSLAKLNVTIAIALAIKATMAITSASATTSKPPIEIGTKFCIEKSPPNEFSKHRDDLRTTWATMLALSSRPE